MRILFCSCYANGLHGSLLHILEYAKYLRSTGHDVSYAGVLMKPSIKDLFIHQDIKVYELNAIPDDVIFDIVWTYHTFLLPFLIARKVQVKKVVSASLSSIMRVEHHTLYYKYVSMLTSISQEVQELHKNMYGIESIVIPNHIPDEFLSVQKQEFSAAPKKIAVVSNHPPRELLDISHPAVSVVYYGASVKNSRPITPELLLHYDVVISIGKTVFYCMGLGVPVFEYDRFGGCGFITPDKLRNEEKTNFSGRSTYRKLTGEEIIQEIFSTYPQALREVPEVRAQAMKNYRLSALVERQLALLKDSPDFQPPDTVELRIFNENCCAAIEIIHTLQKKLDSIEVQKTLSGHILKYIEENFSLASVPAAFCFKLLYATYAKIKCIKCAIRKKLRNNRYR